MTHTPSGHAKPTKEEVVATALNEQGFLFQHKIVKVLQNGGNDHRWQVEAVEVPVSLANGAETRVDIVLRHQPSQHPGQDSPWRVVMECKRSSRDYKQWVFFANNEPIGVPCPSRYCWERIDLARQWDTMSEPILSHRLDYTKASQECPTFDFGIEARTEPPDRQKRASATESIEDALHQVTLGVTGLCGQLKRAREVYLRFIPVVVTTAELSSVAFRDDKVSLDRGVIAASDLRLEPRQWLAVNYRISDVVSEHSGINTVHQKTVSDMISARQARTVFVVQAMHIQSFLVWLDKTFPSQGR